MGLFGKLFGSTDEKKEAQSQIKIKDDVRLDWEIDGNEYKKQDYIASSEYIIPSHETVTEVFNKLDNGEILVANNVFFRVDYISHANDWHKQRDYTFEQLTLKRKEENTSDSNVYILEGNGTFLKEDLMGDTLDSKTNDVSVYTEMTYNNNKLDMTGSKGFDDTDEWYGFMLFFKMLEYYKYPTEESKTISAEKNEEKNLYNLSLDK